VGAGAFGCLAALALVRRGHRVVLVDREAQILARASRFNEGKIHLGFTYGLDLSGRTAARMFEYGSRFEQTLKELVGSAADVIMHRRGTYAMLHDSLLPVDGALRHIASIEAMHQMHIERGLPSLSPDQPFARRMSKVELEASFSDAVIAAFDVAEFTIDCDMLCELVGRAVRAEPRIEVITGFDVLAIEEAGRPRIVGTSGAPLGPFDQVVNGAWDGMPAIERRGGRGSAGFCLRGKTGFFTRVLSEPRAGPVTFTWGSYGDFVPQPGGRAYLSWYPSCRMGFTTDVSEGAQWFDDLSASFDFERAYRESRGVFASLLPGLEVAVAPEMPRAGAILAAAHSDIDDPGSGLHRRTDFGIFPHGRILSVNTGKLTCAPGLALELAALL
jgi:glycine/D-amino acid oxidase-like deaminating enzyme